MSPEPEISDPCKTCGGKGCHDCAGTGAEAAFLDGVGYDPYLGEDGESYDYGTRS